MEVDGKIDHVLDLIKKFPHLSGISISSAFHYNYYKGIFDRKFYQIIRIEM